jgi:hypothetical protein
MHPKCGVDGSGNDVDHLAGGLFLVTGGLGSSADRRDKPLCLQIRATVARESPVCAAMFQQGRRSWRSLSTSKSSSGAVLLRSRCGRLERPCNPMSSFD